MACAAASGVQPHCCGGGSAGENQKNCAGVERCLTVRQTGWGEPRVGWQGSRSQPTRAGNNRQAQHPQAPAALKLCSCPPSARVTIVQTARVQAARSRAVQHHARQERRSRARHTPPPRTQLPPLAPTEPVQGADRRRRESAESSSSKKGRRQAPQAWRRRARQSPARRPRQPQAAPATLARRQIPHPPRNPPTHACMHVRR
jgi:hypothetical protein